MKYAIGILLALSISACGEAPKDPAETEAPWTDEDSGITTVSNESCWGECKKVVMREACGQYFILGLQKARVVQTAPEDFVEFENGEYDFDGCKVLIKNIPRN